MQWYSLVSILVLIIWAISVKTVLAFSFSAIVTFILAQNLLDSGAELDFFRLFGSKSKSTKNESKVDLQPFPQTLVGCKQTLIKYILRDFVISWFENVGIGDTFVVETKAVLEEATEALYEKIILTNITSYSSNLCIILHQHFVAFQAAKQQEFFKHSEVNFQAYKSSKKRNSVPKQDELKYLRSVVDLLLQKLVKKQTLNCDAGRFILREILAVKLLLPILDTFADPDFLNQSIINIFGEESQQSNTCGEIANDNHDLDSVKSKLMKCLEGQQYFNTNNDIVSSAGNSEASVQYKFKNTTVTEHEHNELVEITMETHPTSNGVKKDASKTLLQSCKDTENTRKKNANTSLDKAEFDNEHRNTFEIKEKSAKPLAIFGVKMPPSGFIFGRNLRKFHPPSIIRQFGVPKKSSDENGDTTRCSRPNIARERLKRASLSGSPVSDPKLNQGSNPSSFEDIDDFPKDMIQLRENEINKESCENQQTNQTSEIVDDENILLFEKRFTDDSQMPDDRQAYKNLSSSGEEWESEVFESVDNDDDFFKTTTNDSSFSERKQCESVPSLAELALPKPENPCLLIHIVSTELIADGTWEPHKSKYTVYHISYSNKLWSSTDNVDDGEETSSVNENNVIKRRYREFMELHNRLSNGPYASCLKDVPKPNRKFNSPFFRLDEDVIEGRQHLLETYLKGLVTHPNILNSDEFKGFLGIGDESQTTFHRQMTVPAVPRIDKKLQKKVTKIIDHIKTAFETGPIDGDREEEYNDIRQVLGEDKLSPDDIRTFATCSSSCRSHNCCCAGKDFQKFVGEKHRKSNDDPRQSKTDSKKPQEYGCITECKWKRTFQTSSMHVPNTMNITQSKSENDLESFEEQQKSFPLTETIFNLSCQLLQDQKSWVCLHPVHQATTTLFGCLFEWWFESAIGELITEEQWHHYLTLLKATVWPSGKLMDYSKEEKTHDEKEQLKEKAIQTLSDFFGGVIHVAVGSDAIKTSARSVVESLQCEEINRQLFLEVLEVTLVEIFPEMICEQEMHLSSRNC